MRRLGCAVVLCALGCDRGFDEVPSALLSGVYDKERGVYHDPEIAHGNDRRGIEFPLTICPDWQVVLALEVGLDANRWPVTLELRCGTVGLDGAITPTSERRSVEAEGAAPVDVLLLECPAGQAAVSFRGALYWDGAPLVEPADLFVSMVGLECAEAQGWLAGSAFADVTRQAGASGVGVRNFVDGCAREFAFFKGFSGRVSRRFEQLSVACGLPYPERFPG